MTDRDFKPEFQLSAASEKILRLTAENARLRSEIREYKLLTRAYFASKIVAHYSNDPAQAAEAVLKESEFEKRILSELQTFSEQEQQELPFKDYNEDETRI